MDFSPVPEEKFDDATIVRIYMTYRQESWHGKRNRMALNAQNFEMYHHRQDWRHKTSGQSKEFLPKVSTVVEQMTFVIQQGLVEQKDWFSVERSYGVQDDLFTEDVIKKILINQLGHNDIYNFIGDSIKMGALGALMVAKVHGEYKEKSRYVVDPSEDGSHKLSRISKDHWQLKIDLVRQENFYPDPMGSGLYICEDIPMDWHQLMELAELYPDEYDRKAIEGLGEYRDFYDESRKSRETDQNMTYENAQRKRVLVTEVWGTIVHQDGTVYMKNCVGAFANKTTLIRKPKPIKSWSGMDPYVTSPVLRVPHSVWHRAPMDAPAALNQAANEMFNLILDGGMMSVYGIKQIRENWIDDPTQISDGIKPGDTLRVNTACPPGAHVLERVDTSSVPQDGLSVFNQLEAEFNVAAMTNDLRMGTLPERQVKATEIVSSNQAINGTFGGIVKTIEEQYAAPLLNRCWVEIAQNIKDMDPDELRDILGEETAIRILSLSPEEIFARSVSGNKFKVFGLSMTLGRMNDFKKIGALLQTIAGSPDLMASFQQKYDMSKLLGEIIKSLDIDEDKIEKSEGVGNGIQMGVGGGGPGSPSPQTPNMQSQVPQISGMSNETGVPVQNPANQMGLTEPVMQ